MGNWLPSLGQVSRRTRQTLCRLASGCCAHQEQTDQDAVTHEFGRKLGSSESGQRVPAWVLDSLRAVVLRLDDPAETQVNPLMMIVLEILDGSPDPLSARQAA